MHSIELANTLINFFERSQSLRDQIQNENWGSLENEKEWLIIYFFETLLFEIYIVEKMYLNFQLQCSFSLIP